MAAFSAQDGALLSVSFIDLNASGAPSIRPQQAVNVSGDWWVTDDVLEVAHTWSNFGTEYLGDNLTGSGDLFGAVNAFGATWFCSDPPGPTAGSLTELRQGNVTTHAIPFGIHNALAFGGELLLIGSSRIERWDPVAGASLGTLYSTASQGGMLQGTVHSNGNLLIVRQAANQDLIEMDSSGTIVAQHDIGALGISLAFGCLELGNGGFLITTEDGAWVTDATFSSATHLIDGIRCRFITHGPQVTIGASYCGPAEVNSTGLPATIGATGSTQAGDGALRLMAYDLPSLQSGYFLASQTQGFVMNPGGSSGNICLGGAIGRLSMQVGNSASVGYIDIEVDTTSVPLPNGTTTILAGQTWNWQAWYRDNVGGVSTSNFSDAVSIQFQ